MKILLREAVDTETGSWCSLLERVYKELRVDLSPNHHGLELFESSDIDPKHFVTFVTSMTGPFSNCLVAAVLYPTSMYYKFEVSS